MDDWTEKWPTEPGWYWFHRISYIRGDKYHTVAVRAFWAGKEPKRFLVYAEGGAFLDPRDWSGLWSRIPDPQPPTMPR